MHIIWSKSWSLDTQCLEEIISSWPLADNFFTRRIASEVWCRLIGISCRKTWKLEKFISRTKIRLCQLFHWIWGMGIYNRYFVICICWSADRWQVWAWSKLCTAGNWDICSVNMWGNCIFLVNHQPTKKISPAAFLAQTALQLFDISPLRCGQSISDFVKLLF